MSLKAYQPCVFYEGEFWSHKIHINRMQNPGVSVLNEGKSECSTDLT